LSIIDFGLTKVLKKEEFNKMTTGIRGTLQYMSPELLSKRARDDKYIDLFASDMWALGVTFYEMMFHNYLSNHLTEPYLKNSSSNLTLIIQIENLNLFRK